MIAALALARRLWGHAAFRGLVLSVGVLLAITVHGALRYRDGVAAGTAKERAAWSSEVALARASATASQVAADAATSALRDSLSVRDEVVAKLKEQAALEHGKYREALGWYLASKAARPDSVPVTDEQRACDALASSCANTIAAGLALQDSLGAQLRATERMVMRQDSVLRTEQMRTTRTVLDALAQQRTTFRAPSRLAWGTGGALLGAAVVTIVGVFR